MNKHTRPFACSLADCKEKRFASSGDLARHHREVHSPPTFRCNVVSCTRYKRGFGRQYNLTLHIRRVHQGGGLPRTLTCDSNPVPPLRVRDEVVPTSFRENPVLEVLGTETSTLFSEAAIAEKIRELEMTKDDTVARFEEDIAALRRVLSII